MTSIRRMSGRALSGGRRYERMVLGVGGEKSYLETGNRSLRWKSWDELRWTLVKEFELFLRISRDGG
jgi:hypothetical protein